MTYVTLLGWIGTLTVFATYLVFVFANKAVVFHYGNVVGAVLLCIYDATIGAWPAFALSAMFGIAGVLALSVRDRHETVVVPDSMSRSEAEKVVRDIISHELVSVWGYPMYPSAECRIETKIVGQLMDGWNLVEVRS